MARKLRSMFKPVVPQPGTGERPALAPQATAGPVAPRGGEPEIKTETDRDAVARLAYERWLETGGGAVENWVWAEAELLRRRG